MVRLRFRRTRHASPPPPASAERLGAGPVLPEGPDVLGPDHMLNRGLVRTVFRAGAGVGPAEGQRGRRGGEVLSSASTSGQRIDAHAGVAPAATPQTRAGEAGIGGSSDSSNAAAVARRRHRRARDAPVSPDAMASELLACGDDAGGSGNLDRTPSRLIGAPEGPAIADALASPDAIASELLACEDDAGGSGILDRTPSLLTGSGASPRSLSGGGGGDSNTIGFTFDDAPAMWMESIDLPADADFRTAAWMRNEGRAAGPSAPGGLIGTPPNGRADGAGGSHSPRPPLGSSLVIRDPRDPLDRSVSPSIGLFRHLPRHPPRSTQRAMTSASTTFAPTLANHDTFDSGSWDRDSQVATQSLARAAVHDGDSRGARGPRQT